MTSAGDLLGTRGEWNLFLLMMDPGLHLKSEALMGF